MTENNVVTLTAREYMSLIQDRDRLNFLEGPDCYKWKCVPTGHGGHNLCRVHIGGDRTLREAIDKQMKGEASCR